MDRSQLLEMQGTQFQVRLFCESQSVSEEERGQGEDRYKVYNYQLSGCGQISDLQTQALPRVFNFTTTPFTDDRYYPIPFSRRAIIGVYSIVTCAVVYKACENHRFSSLEEYSDYMGRNVILAIDRADPDLPIPRILLILADPLCLADYFPALARS